MAKISIRLFAVIFLLTAIFSGISLEAAIASQENNLLQFSAGGHILGFTPDKAYLVAMDHALAVEFLGSNGIMPAADAAGTGVDSKAHTKSLSKVVYNNLWDGISLTYEATEDGITESTYYVSAHADVSRIRLKYNIPVEVRGNGTLRFTFDRGYMTESAPVAWQEIGGMRIPVKAAFFSLADGQLGFNVGEYNHGYPLIIDPTLTWNTFYGEDDADIAFDIALDGNGNIYVTGYSQAGWETSTQVPLHAYSGDNEIVVMKLNSSGGYLWHTYYGSESYSDIGYGITVDDSGVYVTGASNFTWNGDNDTKPLSGHRISTNSNVVVLKLGTDGSYVWHTFYGEWDDSGYDIVISGNSIYVTGRSEFGGWWYYDGLTVDSQSYALTPLHDYSGRDAIFVLSLSVNGVYQWHTFYGASGSTAGDSGQGIALDSSGNIYVAGQSVADWDDEDYKGDGENDAPLHAYRGNTDITVLKLDKDGAYQWHAFYGSSGNDFGSGIAVDSSDNIYITGYSPYTWGSPISSRSSGVFDIAIFKLNSSGVLQWNTFAGATITAIGYTTYDGVSGSHYPVGIAIDANDNIYITGASYATFGAPVHAHSYDGASTKSYDAVIMRLDTDGTLVWNTFFGSDGYDKDSDGDNDYASHDSGFGITTDDDGNIFTSGRSSYTWGDPINDIAKNDIFVLKMNDDSTASSDADGDGMDDAWETLYFGDIISRNGKGDYDGDGLTDLEEYTASTKPKLADTDSDGMPDGWEVEYSLNPLVDDASLDPDKDGYTNLEEYEQSGDPNSADTPFPWELFYPSFTGG